MLNVPSFTPAQRDAARTVAPSCSRLALDENELAARWGIAPKTLRRWRQEQLGPVFLKLGGRVTYLLPEIEAYERRVSRHATFARAYEEGARA